MYKDCASCGESFYVNPADYERRKHCSKECYRQTVYNEKYKGGIKVETESGKSCSVCGEVKPYSEFVPRKDGRGGGYQSQCRKCAWSKIKQYWEENPDKKKESDAKYYEAHKEERLQKSKQRQKENKDRYEVARKRWREENKDHINQRHRKRYKNDREYAMGYKIRNMVHRVIRLSREGKDSTSFELVGYLPYQLVERIEYQLHDGMSWENYGDWEIDHKIPVAHFLRKGETRPWIINALSNLQPMWAEENYSKGDQLIYLDNNEKP